MKKPFSFEEFQSIYSKVPRLTVEIVIKNTEGVLLTLRRIHPLPGIWHLPGGTVYFKEPLEYAVKRIAKEELGLDVSVEKFLGYIEYIHQEKGGGFDHPVGIAFLCQPISQEVRLNDDASEAKYFRDFPEDVVMEQKEFLEKLNLN